MKIQNIIGYQGLSKMSNTTITKNNCNCSFKAELWEDEYEPGSIFYLQEKREKEREMGARDFSYYRKDSGVKVTDDVIGKMKINALRYLGNDCYKGGMEGASNYVKELKENGIKKMVVLCDLSECNIAEECNKNSMDWMHVYVPITVRSENVEKDFYENFSYGAFMSAIEALRNGHIFIGCESGNLRTNRFLHAVKLLDPLSKLNLGMSDYDSDDYVLAQWIYKRFSQTQKEKLQYTNEFEQKLKNTLISYVPTRFRTVL